MKVAVLGIGKIGGILGTKWLEASHEVVFGVRDMNSPKVQSFHATRGDNLVVGSLSQAIAFGDVVLFAVPGAAVPAIVNSYAEDLNHMIIIDATNNMGAADMSNVAILTARSPNARVFRAFNSLGWENFAQPQFGDIQADLFYCGSDDASARSAVEQLVSDIGLRPVRLGGLDQVALVDAVTRLWFTLAVGQKMGRHLAFKVLTPD